MLIPFFYSFKDALKDMIGATLYNMIPQASIQQLGQYYIVDAAGIIVWTIVFFIIGIILGRQSK